MHKLKAPNAFLRAKINPVRPSSRPPPIAPNLRHQGMAPVRGSASDENFLMKTDSVEDSLASIIEVVPEDLRDALLNHPRRSDLLEIIMDLGRRPEARFAGQDAGEYLRATEVTPEDLAAASKAVGDFGADNRAGIEGTLHRISAIRNRRGDIVGLTCRIGRAVSGHIEMIRDLLDVPNSILFLGRPGVGKTTVIREIARVLADDFHKRVVIVDSSNEIGGDGDVPHPAIGGARRMQVPDPTDQHRIMLEAVENHMPQVIIVDEISNEAEALACRTIAERGVMLIGTAHGQVLENLVKNPTLSDLIGGVQCVTLGDDEARLRGTQKSVLERKAPPTFPLVIEMRERQTWVAHWVEDSVDALLTGKVPAVQLRRRDTETNKIQMSQMRYDHVCEMLGGGDAEGETRPSNFPRAAPGYASGNGIVTSTVTQSPMVAPDSEVGSGWGGYGGAQIDASAADPYAWAQRLRSVPDKDALAELTNLGYITDGAGPSVKGRSARLGLVSGGATRRSKSRRSNSGPGAGYR